MQTTFSAGTAEELAAELAEHFARTAQGARRFSDMATKVKDRDRWATTAVAYEEASEFCRRLTRDLKAA